jgi:hypothetical protein
MSEIPLSQLSENNEPNDRPDKQQNKRPPKGVPTERIQNTEK